MKLFRRILIFYIFKANFITGDELLLLTSEDKIHWYNTKNNQAKTIAEFAIHMACDFERKYLYYTKLHVSHPYYITIFRADYDGGNIKTVMDSGSADLTTGHISVDHETGNLYYYSSKGIGFYSYTRNYSRTVISTTDLPKDVVYDIGFHGTSPNKRVYVSTEVDLYRSQPGTSNLIDLGTDCGFFTILDNGMVCYQIMGKELHLANLDGVKTGSLPNITITSSILNKIRCLGPGFIWGITAVGDNLYILCLSPNQVLKVNLKTGVKKALIPEMPPAVIKQSWMGVYVLPHEKVELIDQKVGDQKVVLTDQKVVSSTQTATILMVVGGVVTGLVMVVSLIAAIRMCKKNTAGSIPRMHNKGCVKQPGGQEYSSYNSNNSLQDDHVYTTMDSNKSAEYDTIDDHIYVEIL